jgi:heme-degrading monooxygenase HmoA
MEGAAFAGTSAASAPGSRGLDLIDAVELDFHVTPLRAERFYDTYRTAVPRVLAYGARGYVFFRVEEDPDHFVHVSYWDDRADFYRFWMSEEMREIRRRLLGIYGQPLVPHWTTVLAQG